MEKTLDQRIARLEGEVNVLIAVNVAVLGLTLSHFITYVVALI